MPPADTPPPADAFVAAPAAGSAATPAAAATADLAAAATHPVVLFDGVCNLCNATVNFIIDRDPDARFRFTALQSDAGRALLARHGVAPPAGAPDSVLLIEQGRVYDRSSAALRIARGLRGPWRLAYAFVLVPRPLRNLVYAFIARNRYRWFGRQEACRVPTPELRARFL